MNFNNNNNNNATVGCDNGSCNGGRGFQIRDCVFCSPACGNSWFKLEKDDEDYWEEDEEEDDDDDEDEAMNEIKYILKGCSMSRKGNPNDVNEYGSYNTMDEAKDYLEIVKNEMPYPPTYNLLYVEYDGMIEYQQEYWEEDDDEEEKEEEEEEQDEDEIDDEYYWEEDDDEEEKEEEEEDDDDMFGLWLF